jgi:glutamate racemase
MNTKLIGIIDSGSGGLSVWQSIVHECPDETIVYLGDHLFLPYGSKKTSFIVSRMKHLIDFLLKNYFCKVIIVACNSATVAGIEKYRKTFPDIPIIGVVPVIKTAAEVTKTGTIAVLSTPYTTKSAYQKRLIQHFADNKTVYAIGCPKLVSYIEKGLTKGPMVQKVLKNVFRTILQTPVDAIALGCTHYPFVKKEMTSILGPSVTLLDSGGAVARQTKRILNSMGIASTKKITGDSFLTTGDAQKVSGIASLLTQETVTFQHVRIL